jgi:predicted MFS family arabinose efflux permease
MTSEIIIAYMVRPPPSAAQIVLSAFLGLAIAIGVGRFAFTPLLPMMMADAGVSLAEGGWLATANYAGYLLGALTASRLPARDTTAMRAALVIIVAATALMAWTESFAAWMLLRALAGVASAWVMVLVSAWSLRELALRDRASLSARAYGGVGTGIAATGLLVLLLAAINSDSSQAWWLCGLFALALMALAWPGMRASADAQVEQQAPVATNKTGPHDLRLVLCYGAYGLGYIIPATFLPALARQSMPDPLVFNWVWPLFGTVAVISTLLAERLQRRYSPLGLWIACHLVIAAGVALLALPDSAVAIVLSAVSVGGTFVVVTVGGFQVARQLSGGDPTRLIGAMTAAFAAGQIAGPLVLAWSERSLGVGASLALAAVALLVSAYALWRMPGQVEGSH